MSDECRFDAGCLSGCVSCVATIQIVSINSNYFLGDSAYVYGEFDRSTDHDRQH